MAHEQSRLPVKLQFHRDVAGSEEADYEEDQAYDILSGMKPYEVRQFASYLEFPLVVICSIPLTLFVSTLISLFSCIVCLLLGIYRSLSGPTRNHGR